MILAGEEGFRDAKWWLGFTKARIAHIKACRACLPVRDGVTCHDQSGEQALTDPRPKGKGFTPSGGVRRRRRCELGLVSAMVSLLQQDKTLYGELCPDVKLKLEATLGNVSSRLIASKLLKEDVADNPVRLLGRNANAIRPQRSPVVFFSKFPQRARGFDHRAGHWGHSE